MTKSVALLVIVGAVVAGTLWAQDRRPEAAIPKHPPGGFMQAKLEHAQQVLAGLALEDFDLIIRQSHELGKMSQNPSWQVLRTAEYSVQSQEFQRAVAGLTKAAKAKNLDGAALRYVEVTLKCVECHKYVRDARLARFDDSPRRGPAGQGGL